MPPQADLPRFFVPGPASSSGLAAGAEIDLEPGEAHHAAHVLRLKAGAPLALFDGCGTAATGRVSEVRKGNVTVTVEAVGPAAPRPHPRVHLAFAVPKGSRLDWLLEKATELGAASLRPVRFERSVAGADALSPAARQRWMGHCISAAKQAGLDWLPVLEDPLPLAAYLEKTAGRPGLFGDLSDDAAPLGRAVRSLARPDALHIVVGAEGGLTPPERTALRQAGFIAVRLGRTTLRIETAAVALTAAAVAASEETC
jgi:16S rRNA (uracil1498-N3)-methyltransferase